MVFLTTSSSLFLTAFLQEIGSQLGSFPRQSILDWNKLSADSPCSLLTINEPHNITIVIKLEAGHKTECEILG